MVIEVKSMFFMVCSVLLLVLERESNCKGMLYIWIEEYWLWCWNGVKYLLVVFLDNGC